MARSSLNNDQKNRIMQLASDGFSQTKIADLYEVSQGTISNVIKMKKYENEIVKHDQMMANAMARGVEAAVLNGELNTGRNNKFLNG